MRRAIVLVVLLLLAGADRAVADDIRVMTFNVWLGGDVVDFGKVSEAIETSGADVVGLQEAEGHTRKIADALGWPYWSDRLHVVSRHPLIDPPERAASTCSCRSRRGRCSRWPTCT